MNATAGRMMRRTEETNCLTWFRYYVRMCMRMMVNGIRNVPECEGSRNDLIRNKML